MFCVIMLFFIKPSQAQETIWPSGYNITASYVLSQSQFSVDDTLIVTRIIVNNEDFDLANSYIEENLPASFSILTSTLTIDSSPVDYFYCGATISEVVPGYNTYRWAIDLPASDTNYNRKLYSGETLALEYSVICREPDDYELIFHTICCFGDNSGIFSTADSISVTVLPSVGIDNDFNQVPATTVVSIAYPNPFNSAVNLRLGERIAGNNEGSLIIYNLLGQQIYAEPVILEDQQIIRWCPSDKLTTGIYLYMITIEDYLAKGKITLIK